MKLPRLLLLALTLAASMAFAQSKAEEEAGDVSEVDKDSSGPLRDRIPPVSGYQFRQEKRFEATPIFGISFRDAFFTKLLFGASATYHFTNMWALSARAAYNLSLISGAAQICTSATSTMTGGCRPPTLSELTTANGSTQNVAFGLINFLASLDLEWAPIYGKFSLSAERFLGFNMYFLAGPALVIYGPQGNFTAGGNVGVGFRFFINKWLTLRLELRDTLYYEVGFQGFPEGQRNSFRNQLGAELGLSFFLPTTFAED